MLLFYLLCYAAVLLKFILLNIIMLKNKNCYQIIIFIQVWMINSLHIADKQRIFMKTVLLECINFMNGIEV